MSISESAQHDILLVITVLIVIIFVAGFEASSQNQVKDIIIP